jgi:polyhydroxyalkanoate synthesis regulator phasin
MKTRSTAMAEDSQNLANLQGQVTKLQQAKMATRAEVQNTREAIDRLTQMVQFLMDDRSRNQKKKKTHH